MTTRKNVAMSQMKSLILISAAVLLLFSAGAVQSGPAPKAAPQVLYSTAYNYSSGLSGIRVRRILILPGAPDALSRTAAEYAAEELRVRLGKAAEVEYRDAFTAPLKLERLGDTLTLLVSRLSRIPETRKTPAAASPAAAPRLAFRLDLLLHPSGGRLRSRQLRIAPMNGNNRSALVVVSDPAGNRDAAVRLAVRRLVAPLRLPPEESVLYEIPDYLYDHVTVIKEPLIELDGTLLQAGFTPQLRRCEVWSIPLEENVAADRKELLEALEDQGFSEADAPRRPFAGKADPNRIDLQYDDLLRATLVIPPSAVPAGDGVTPDGSNRFLLYVSETETEPLSGKAVRRYRKEQPRSFLAAGGFRSLDDAELADTFDRLAAIPGLTLGEQLRLYRDTAGEEQRAILGDRRAKLLAAIVDRIAAMQAEPAFPGYMAQLLEAIDFATPSPGHEKQLGKLWPLVFKADAKLLLKEGKLAFSTPSSKDPNLLLVIPPLRPGGRQYYQLITPSRKASDVSRLYFSYRNLDPRGREIGNYAGSRARDAKAPSQTYNLMLEWARNPEKECYDVQLRYTAPTRRWNRFRRWHDRRRPDAGRPGQRGNFSRTEPRAGISSSASGSFRAG